MFGAAGAIWGFSEVLTLRRPETQEFWRLIALVVGFIFFIRFISQIVDFALETKYGESSVKMSGAQWVRLFQIFSAKLVLEVFGGGGAIWGFSEALTLRNDETIGTWRVYALTVGTIFFIRWIVQITDYVCEIKEEDLIPQNEASNGGKHEFLMNEKPNRDSENIENGVNESSPLMK